MLIPFRHYWFILFCLTINSSLSSCCFRKSQLDTAPESEALQETLITVSEDHEDNEQRRSSFCCGSKKTCLIAGFSISAVALPLVLGLKTFIENIEEKAFQLQTACGTMQNSCDTLNEHCSFLNEQVKALFDLLARLTRITPEQIACILNCSQSIEPQIERIACIINCIKQ